MFNPQMLMMLQQFKSNPMQLLSKKFNIPDGVNVNDPNAILNHLLSTNQVTKQQIDSFQNVKNLFK